MATGSSIFLIALGAILTFAVDATVAGLDIAAVGVILMVAGVLGILVSLFWADRMAGPRRSTVVEERDVVDARGGAAEPGAVRETRTTTRQRV